jgi:hypothetical protein
LVRQLALTPGDQRRLGQQLKALRTVPEYLESLYGALQGGFVLDRIAEQSPWVGVLAKTIVDAAAPVKFLAVVLRALVDEKHPEALLYLACTIAWQRSAEQAFKAVGHPKGTPRDLKREMDRALALLRPGEGEIRFDNFSVSGALEHPFMTEADAYLDAYARTFGFDSRQVRRLQGEIHSRFPIHLKTLLSHDKTRARYDGVHRLLVQGSGEQRHAQEALLEHAEVQRHLFEETPVLGREPFAIADVYVDPDCGVLTWGEIVLDSQGQHRRIPLDPFLENQGGRLSLLREVFRLLGDPDYDDAIVIQGAAGSGKSAFTLRLCQALVREGLRPIRVRLRHLVLDRHVRESIPRAVALARGGQRPRIRRPKDLFCDGDIFRELVSFGGAAICPYVLILDGWDELDLASTVALRQRVEAMLEQVRAEYLVGTSVPIRVILTGRPSQLVAESQFLRRDTVILTLRPFTPRQLAFFVENIRQALRNSRFPHNLEVWPKRVNRDFKPLLDRYASGFRARRDGQVADGALTLEVLGLPLLAHIAMRLMVRWRGDLRGLLDDPSNLYRHLVDQTCRHAGKPDDLDEDSPGHRITGAELRQLLWATATALTVRGRENLSLVELQAAFESAPKETESRARAASEDPLAAMMVSFYFKGGRREAGCEFLHKSFREYLFAEAIIEVLKRSGGHSKGRRSRDPGREFDKRDPRRELTRQLGRYLAPQWLSPTVSRHLLRLLDWELGRAQHRPRTSRRGLPTQRLRWETWARIRDDLAAAWDWWTDAMLLRPSRGDDPTVLEPTLAHGWADISIGPSTDRAVPRLQHLDAHLGDALFFLASVLHYRMAIRDGWAGTKNDPIMVPALLWHGAGPPSDRPARQTPIIRDQHYWVLFAPGAGRERWFRCDQARMNAVGGRPHGPWPRGAQLCGTDLRGLRIAFDCPDPDDTWSDVVTPLRHANLDGASLRGGWLRNVDGRETVLTRTDLRNTELDGADFSLADITEARLEGARFERALFDGVTGGDRWGLG